VSLEGEPSKSDEVEGPRAFQYRPKISTVMALGYGCSTVTKFKSQRLFLSIKVTMTPNNASIPASKNRGFSSPLCKPASQKCHLWNSNSRVPSWEAHKKPRQVDTRKSGFKHLTTRLQPHCKHVCFKYFKDHYKRSVKIVTDLANLHYITNLTTTSPSNSAPISPLTDSPKSRPRLPNHNNPKQCEIATTTAKSKLEKCPTHKQD